VSYYLGGKLTDQKIEQVLKIGIEQTHETHALFDKNRLFAKMLGTRTRVREFILDRKKVSEKELLGIFSEYAKENSDYLSIYLLDKNGIGLVSTDPRFIGQDYSFRDYFKKSIKGEPAVSSLVGKTSNEFGYYFSHPVKADDGEVIGVLVVKTNSVEINNSILSSEISKGVTSMMVDEFGVVLVSNKKERFLNSLGKISSENNDIIKQTNRFLGKEINSLGYDSVQRVVNNYRDIETVKLYDDRDGDEEIISVIRIGDLPFYLISEIELKHINYFVLSIVFPIVLIIVFGMAISGLLIYLLINNFIRPLQKFKVLSESIGKGDFSKKININTRDEFSDLSSAFNKMTDNLSDLYRDMDKKVQEKTAGIKSKTKEVEDQNNTILNILKDVENEKKKVEIIASDLEKFKLAVDNATDQVVITDSEGIVIYGNERMEKITGYTREEALGKKAGVLWRLPMADSYYKNLWETIKVQKKTFLSQIQNKRKNGEIYTADISISPILNDKNDILYFVAIEHDITERVEAEDQIRKVLNDMQEQAQNLIIAKSKNEAILTGIGDGVVTTNQDGVITFANQSTLDMLGFKIDEVLDKSVIDVLKISDENGDAVPVNRRPMIRAITTGEKATVPLGTTYYYQRKDGSRFPVGITVSPFLFNEKIIGTIEVFRDITVEKDVDKAKTEFVSLASHQLRTPLTSIGWYAEMLLSGDAGKLNAQQKEYLNEVDHGNRRMVKLVNSLLNISRIELGTFSVEPELTDLKVIVGDVVDELKTVISENKTNVEVVYGDGLEKIFIDPRLIRIVYQNLLTNALKYTPIGGNVKLEIKTDGDNILNSISDNGCGIPSSQQSSIFQKLFRADNAKFKDSEGTGLGLYIVKSIIEQSSGGKIWFESVENKGTTFFFTLPKKGMTPKKGSRPLN
jgi:PAS domain S-box-containing protein